MKKLTLLISALALGAGLVVAAQTVSPTAQAVNIIHAKEALAKTWDAKIAAAKAVKDTAAVATIAAERKSAIAAYNDAHKAEVAALIGSIDEIALNNPGTAAQLIKQHLAVKNAVDGVTPATFDQNEADRALAARLLDLSTGSQAYFYFQYYASADELRSRPGTSSVQLVQAIGKRARALDIYAEVIPALYQKSLGMGLVNKGYDTWFNQKVRALWKTDRAAALKLLEEEQAGIGTLSYQTTASKARLEQLRELSARFAEIIARS